MAETPMHIMRVSLVLNWLGRRICPLLKQNFYDYKRSIGLEKY